MISVHLSNWLIGKDHGFCFKRLRRFWIRIQIPSKARISSTQDLENWSQGGFLEYWRWYDKNIKELSVHFTIRSRSKRKKKFLLIYTSHVFVYFLIHWSTLIGVSCLLELFGSQKAGYKPKPPSINRVSFFLHFPQKACKTSLTRNDSGIKEVCIP